MVTLEETLAKAESALEWNRRWLADAKERGDREMIRVYVKAVANGANEVGSLKRRIAAEGARTQHLPAYEA